MLRPFAATSYGTSASALRRLALPVLLTLCAAFIQPGAVNALTAAAPLPGLDLLVAAGPAVARPAAYCDSGEPCPDYEPAPRPYKVGPPIEVPCERTPMPRIYTYRADPPSGYAGRDEYEEVPEDRRCGVRCWYRRIRQGFCGRGCDYYQFRLRHFPSGRFGEHEGRRVACANRW